MIRLIQNEITKILKKKSIYIMLLVTLAFIIFFNYMTATHNNSYYFNYSESYISYTRDRLKKLDANKAEDITEYIETKSMVDMFDLLDNYKKEDWQTPIIEQKASNYLRTINIYTYGPEKNETARIEAEKTYAEFVSKLERNDWRYFVTEELKDIENQIREQETLKTATVDRVQLESISSQISDLELKKQVLSWRLEKNIPYGYNQMNTYLDSYYSNKSQCKSYEQKDSLTYEEKQEYQRVQKTAALAQYQIENEKITEKQSNFQSGLIGVFSNYEIFIIIIIVMIAGTIVSEEFNKGTVKLLLVRPYSRVKILCAKCLTTMIILLLAIILILIMQCVVGGIAFGFDGFATTIAQFDFNTSKIITFPLWQYIGILLLAKLPLYLLINMIAFAISTIFTNSPLAIVISLLGYMSTSIINALAQAYHIDILKYFITMNWNIEQYLFGALPPFEGMTFTFSIIVCLVYFILLLIPSMIFFKKKNIKNI